MPRKPLYAPFYGLILCLLTACASMGYIAPESFGERLAAAYTLNTAIREGIDSTLNSGGISSADAEQALNETRNLRKGLDAVRAIGASDPSTAEGRLKLLNEALQELRSRLIAKGVKVQEVKS